MKRINNSWLWIFCFCLLSIIACKEKTDGCLDVEATNFDVSADEPCPDDCCEYPMLSLEIAHRIDTLIFAYGTAYDLGEQTGRILKIKFYLSDVRLTNDAETLEVLERIDLTPFIGDVINRKDDFALISRDNAAFTYTLGETRQQGTFDTLRFSVGVDEQVNLTDPTTLTEGHPLGIQSDSLWSPERAYIFNKIIMVPDTMAPMDTIEYNITGDPNLVEISIPYEKTVRLGVDVTIPLKIDYQKWFTGIDFVADSPELVMEKIVTNLANSFSINE